MISVIIPTYNRERSIIKSVSSVLRQTYHNLELIVVDDGSTDNTETVLKQIKDDRLIYVKRENEGACAARNYGIELAKGEYIALNDSDDEWHADKLERQIDVLQSTGADLVFCKYNRIEQGKAPRKAPIRFNEGFLDPVRTVYGIGTQTIIAKAEVFKEFKFDIDMPRFQDLELLLRISRKYSIYCMDEALVEFYTGESSISKKPEKLYDACVLLLKKYPELVKNYPEMTRSFSNLIFGETSWLDERKINRKLKKEMYGLAYKLNPKLKTRMKIILKYLNLYNLAEKLIVKK